MSNWEKVDRAVNLLGATYLLIIALTMTLSGLGIIAPVLTPPWWLVAGAFAALALHALRNGLGLG